jgi:hypothetical protein
MTDNKRAADDAEREKFNAWFKSEHTRMAVSPSFACKAWARAAWQAALSSRADGCKGEAVYQVKYESGAWLDHDREKYEYFGRVGYETRILYTAPQAECAPREAQPVGPRTTLNYDGTFDTPCAHCGGNGCFACLKSAAPTPERADADTAGAKPTCPHCGLTDIEFSRVCHNSACSGYAKEESFYRGWENTAAPASQERADAGKDAALLEALRKIAAIENKMYGGDWDEIEEARSIASIAILAANK